MKNIKELADKVQTLKNSILDFSPPSEVEKIQNEITSLKYEITQTQIKEQRQREIQKDEQAKGDAIYWAIYNLDCKNPNNQKFFEHLPPEQLMSNILDKDRRITEIMAEIQTILKK